MKVALAGYGIEGKASLKYWQALGADVTIVDERDHLDDLPSGIKTILGAGAFSELDGFDLVIRTASLRPDKIHTDGKVWSSTNEFFAKCAAPIIGVTGTKGKGTTASFIASTLRAAGKTVHLVGNIGLPGLEVLHDIHSDDVVVYELSSFQLWDIERSPHVAVVLPIEPDHLDVHKSFEEYIEAKSNIAAHQSTEDVVIFHRDNQQSRQIADLSPARKIEYPSPIDLFESDVRLPGAHNLDNASAAIEAVRVFGIDDAAIHAGLASFEGLPHRLKFVAETRGISWYDDSIATTPGSVIAALNSFDNPIILLMGGHDKGGDYSELMQLAAKKGAQIIAYGANRSTLKHYCGEYGVACYEDDGGMKEIVARAASLASAGSVVVLSPAAASFDMFKNYADRGDQFVAAVRSLGE